MVVCCSESIECFTGVASKFLYKRFFTILVAPIIACVIIRFFFHIRIIHYYYYYYHYYYHHHPILGTIFSSFGE